MSRYGQGRARQTGTFRLQPSKPESLLPTFLRTFSEGGKGGATPNIPHQSSKTKGNQINKLSEERGKWQKARPFPKAGNPAIRTVSMDML